MSILVNASTQVLVQGITGANGKFHALGCREYGTKVVAGVTPGKGGQSVEGIPVFNSVRQACQAERIDAQLQPEYTARTRIHGQPCPYGVTEYGPVRVRQFE